jgi:hypothetical protein
MACATHQARLLTKDTRECVVDLHCWAEAVDESPIVTPIFAMIIGDSTETFSRPWSSWRIASGEFGCSSMASKRIFKEIYYFFRIIGQGIDGEFDVRSGGRRLSSRRHEDKGLSHVILTLFSFLFREGTNREKGEQGLRRRECELVAYVEKVRHADGE